MNKKPRSPHPARITEHSTSSTRHRTKIKRDIEVGGDMQEVSTTKARRTASACNACRQSKIKCSGEEPCANCRRRMIKCRFSDGGNKIVVSERYLRHLQRLCREQRQPESGSHLPLVQNEGSTEWANTTTSKSNADLGNAVSSTNELLQSQVIDPAFSIWTSPFQSPSATIANVKTHKDKRKWVWLAPSSTRSFTVRLLLMMTDKLYPETPNSPLTYVYENAFFLRWKPCSDDAPPDISGLPSIDHALYLFSTVKFHLGQHYRFLDQEAFIGHMSEFYYGDAQTKATESRLWFVQFLIVLAFGTAFLSKSRNPREPPGAKYFTRAMSLMPDHTSIWKDSILGIEVLILVGLYLYSTDQRERAHVFLGQAVRIAQMEGLHTRLPEEELGAETVSQCRNLWWTLYIMDHHFATSLGVPMSIADSDVTTLVNSTDAGAQEDTTLNLRVRLSHLLSVILATIYKTEQSQLSEFLETTRSILQTLAGHAQEFENIIHVKLRNSVEAMPRGTRHITLLYHQCVILATRPLLLSVLRERLEQLDRGDRDWQSFLALTTTLISTGIKSAVKTVQILSEEDSLLEVFLPFDLEFIYGAALHLIMANTLFPGVADDPSYAQQALSILDEMISNGNTVAEPRKTELVHLETLCHELAMQSEQRGLQTLTSAGPECSREPRPGDNVTIGAEQEALAPGARTGVTPMDGDHPTSPSSVDPYMASSLEYLDNIGISSSEFLEIAGQLGHQDILSTDP